MKARLLVLTLMILLSASFAQAATIHGTVYNLELERVQNVIVEIDTQPNQQFIATNGSYSFNVPRGVYTLSAQILENGTVTDSTVEQISVQAEGSYVLDLLLFPDLEGIEEVEDILTATDDVIIEESGLTDDNTFWYVLAGIAALVLLGVIWYFVKKSSRKTKPQHAEELKPEEKEKHGHKEHRHAETAPQEHVHHEDAKAETADLPATEKDDAKEIVDFIKKEGGRTTQKDIRKVSSLSEAKISLIITELEHKGVIEKIKKGRGNVIVLK